MFHQVLFLVIGLLAPLFCHAVVIAPEEPLKRPSQILSFKDDAKIEGCNVLNVGFQPHRQALHSFTAWFATSDGLLEYDGYNWLRHGTNSGLPSDFIRSVLVTRAGILWVGTDRGAGVYDGRTYTSFGSETNLAGLGVRRMVEDGDGTIWFCSDSWPKAAQRGGITSYQAGVWHTYHEQDGLPSEYVVNGFRDSTGRMWAVAKEGLAYLDGKKWVTSLIPNEKLRSFSSGSLAEVAGVGLVFSTGANLLSYTNGLWVPESNQHHDFGILGTRDGRLIGCKSSETGRKSFAEWRSNAWESVSVEFEVPHGYTEDIQEDPEGNLWVVGFETITCWKRHSNWHEFHSLGVPRVVDASGAVWFEKGSMANGLGREYGRYSNGNWERLERPLDGITLDTTGNVWGWDGSGVSTWIGTDETRFGETSTGLRVVEAVRSSRNGGCWVLGKNLRGVASVAVYQGGIWNSTPLPADVGDAQPAVVGDAPDGAWFILKSILNTNYIAFHARETNSEEVAIPADILSEYHLGLWPDANGLDLWLYGAIGLFRWTKASRAWEPVANLPGRAISPVLGRRDEIWAICNGLMGGRDGVARFRGGLWEIFPSTTGFDATIAPDGTLLWVGKDGFSYVPDSPTAGPVEVSLPEGVVLSRALKDRQGTYWAGNGSVQFQFVPDGLPPHTSIAHGITNFISGESIHVVAGALERFYPSGYRHDYAFSWRLDGGAWTPFAKENTRTFAVSDRTTRSHRIEVRARDAGGDIDPVPAELDVQVHPLPLQDRRWFLPAVFVVLSGLGGLALVAVRARRQVANYARTLEKSVAERTAALEADISRRRRVEDSLRESEERFAKAFDANPAIIAISTYPEGLYVDVNQAYTDVLGFTRLEVVGYRAADFGIWPVAEQRAAIISAIERGEQVRSFECTIRAKSGKIHTMLASCERIELGSKACLLFINYDITARKEAEAVVLEARARFKQLADNIREVFWLTDIETNQMLYVSPGYERIWGRTCESLYQSAASWMEAVHSEDRKRVKEVVEKGPHAGEYDLEYRIVRPDGSIRWIHDRAFPVRDASGRMYRQAGVAEDVTERRQLESQYRQAQKMEAIGTLSGGIAHDFNNILTAVFGNLDLAKLDLAPDHPAYTSLSEIEKAADRAKSLVRQILAFSRQQPQSRHVVSLAPIIIEAASLLRATLPAGVELIKWIDPAAPNVFADGSQIHQIVMNLCTNSWHALNGSTGRIEVRLELAVIDGNDDSLVPRLRSGRYACLSVSDNGQGISAATLERMFEPFFTTKEPGRGTGLGLSVVHGIVQAHDGAIRVTSRLGVGTTFQLFFPAMDAEADLVSNGDRQKRLGAGQRVLCVDDEPPLVDVEVRTLQHLGYTATGVNGPLEGLKVLEAEPDGFDLVITDLHMPGMSGIEFAQKARQLRPGLKILLCSGHLSDEVVEKARAVGVIRTLNKPFSLDEISQLLWEVLNASPLQAE